MLFANTRLEPLRARSPLGSSLATADLCNDIGTEPTHSDRAALQSGNRR